MRVLEFNRYLKEANKMNFSDERRSKFIGEIERRLNHDEESVDKSTDFIIEEYKQVERGLDFVKKVQNNKLMKILFKKELLELQKQIRPKEQTEEVQINETTETSKKIQNNRMNYINTLKSNVDLENESNESFQPKARAEEVEEEK